MDRHRCRRDHRFDALGQMIGKTAKFFWMLAILGGAAWLLGFVAGGIASPFDVRTGELILRASFWGEFLMYICGAAAWILNRIDPNRKREFNGFSGGKRYGNTPPAMPSNGKSNR